MGKQTIWYSAESYGEASRYALEIPDTFSTARPLEQEMIARMCADDLHSNHDGWELRWPIEFRLYETEDGQEIARLEVDRDFDPVFTARHVDVGLQET